MRSKVLNARLYFVKALVYDTDKTNTITPVIPHRSVRLRLKGADKMASVKWQGGKYHGAGEAKAHFRHDEKEQRMKHEHANEHINKELTKFNYSMYGLSYEEMCEKYDERIAELDATGTNKRKDRTTLQSLEVPAPEGLPPDKRPAWFRRVHEIIVGFYGERNVIEGHVHVDEVHEYIDAETHRKRVSCEHLHEGVIPVVDGVLNGKKFSSRANINRLNKAVDEMSQKEFGVSFHTGKGGKSTKPVEQLKQESATLEAVNAVLVDMCDELNAEKAATYYELDEAWEQFEKTKEQFEERFADRCDEKDAEYAEREAESNEREAALDAKEKRQKRDNEERLTYIARQEKESTRREQSTKSNNAKSSELLKTAERCTADAQDIVNEAEKIPPDASREEYMKRHGLEEGYQNWLAHRDEKIQHVKQRVVAQKQKQSALKTVLDSADSMLGNSASDDYQIGS